MDVANSGKPSQAIVWQSRARLIPSVETLYDGPKSILDKAKRKSRLQTTLVGSENYSSMNQ